MANKKVEHKITRSTSEAKGPAAKKSTAGLRIGSVICWLCALACEVLAILVFSQKLTIQVKMTPLVLAVIFLIVDLILVIIGSRLWVAANHINPASEKNKVAFFLYNNMGVIVATLCFIPFIIIALTDKNADKKSKTIATVVAVIALAAAGLGSADWDPVSKEQQEAERVALYGTDVYWTEGGAKYHTHEDCQHLNRTYELKTGSVAQAVDEGKDNLCKTCAKRDELVVNVEKSAENAVDTVKDATSDAINSVVDSVKEAVNQ